MKDPELLPEGLQAFVLRLSARRYSPNTIKTYQQQLLHFAHRLEGRGLDAATSEDISSYLSTKESLHSKRTAINALRCYYQADYERLGINHVQRPPTEQAPDILSKEEVCSLLQSCDNLKHKAMFMCAYGMGLRVSEIVHLKLSDINLRKQLVQILVDGKTTRKIPLPSLLRDTLRDYIQSHSPQSWLFEGYQQGQPCTVRAVQQAIKSCIKKAQLRDNITVQSLRHSFAVHLLEKGTDVALLQALLGHKDPKTTKNYNAFTAINRRAIRSPLEELK